MARPLLLAAALLASAGAARAAEPLKSADAFEADARRCLLEHRTPATCLGDLVRGHFVPGNDKLDEVVPEITSVLAKWLGGDRVFAVYTARARKVDAFYEERVYLLEDTTGSVMVMDMAFVRRLGKLYVKRFNLSSKSEAIEAALGTRL